MFGDPVPVISQIVGQSSQNSQLLLQDFNETQRDWAKRKIKPTFDIKLAREAIGVSAADAPPADGESSAKPGSAAQ